MNSRPLEPNRFLNVNELAELLSVPKGWIYERTSRDEIPFHKIGKYVRFDWNEIQNWLEQQRNAGNKKASNNTQI